MMHPLVIEALEELSARTVRDMSDAQLLEQSTVTQIYAQALHEEMDRRMRALTMGDVAGHA